MPAILTILSTGLPLPTQVFNIRYKFFISSYTMSEDILEAARAIRPYLPELLTAEQAKAIDHQLTQLLTQQDQTKVDNLILDILCSQEPTRQWIDEFLELKLPPTLEKSYQPIPGNLTPVSSVAKYTCPFGDYVWYQRQVGEPIPNCPTHEVPLEKV